jgi:hypothetical protein
MKLNSFKNENNENDENDENDENNENNKNNKNNINKNDINKNDSESDRVNENDIDDSSNNGICHELKNIKYKSMLLNGITPDLIVPNNLSITDNIDNILQNERNINLKEPWNKLDKTVKISKLCEFVDTIVNENNKLTSSENIKLKEFLIHCLDQTKLHKVKDVTYNKETGKIEQITLLYFNDVNRKFTLKKHEKRQSTLKSLGPKTRKKTNKIENELEKNLKQKIKNKTKN